jgi:hypothetical protein
MKHQAEDMARIDAALKTLGEHFDAVHIFVSRHEGGELNGTISANKGCGNYCARYGQVKTWVEGEEEKAKMQARKEHFENGGGINAGEA